MSETLYISNDNRIKYIGLKDADGNYQNAATVEVTLNDSNGNALSGQTWPLALSYVAGSNGDYQEVLQDTISGLKDGDQLTAVIDITSAGLTANYQLPVTAEIRKA